MYEKLNREVDELFKNAPKTSRANELKEEVLANLIDRYNDLIAGGKNEEEAIKKAIAGVGDIDELIRGLNKSDVFNYEQLQKDKQKSALILSISVGLYIMSVVVLILCTSLFDVSGEISVCLMLTIDAVATGLIIYNANSRPKYIKADNTMVEDFKEWKSANTERNNILRSVKSLVWTLTLIAYFIFSFAFHGWAYSWIIFFIGFAVERVVTLIFQIKE
ncbi:hypothetical protein SAMN02745163_02555 [Clostridium cavendishii DSM 21758]|uniref:Uncharacterized protein n=1 Tax=Clostridium cavendishii DSM 21758 TaxID=1121302 RepID=A0A1M6M0T5_9CLOT|nr:permease prefix domain 1-containing protein [Clostridium cavendishii]SHJ77014.1 hypothetical protein SAMN02745163_02555 [Clostridium cavendishii DSM 21758]